jgi:hypothetical protein
MKRVEQSSRVWNINISCISIELCSANCEAMEVVAHGYRRKGASAARGVSPRPWHVQLASPVHLPFDAGGLSASDCSAQGAHNLGCRFVLLLFQSPTEAGDLAPQLNRPREVDVLTSRNSWRLDAFNPSRHSRKSIAHYLANNISRLGIVCAAVFTASIPLQIEHRYQRSSSLLTHHFRTRVNRLILNRLRNKDPPYRWMEFLKQDPIQYHHTHPCEIRNAAPDESFLRFTEPPERNPSASAGIGGTTSRLTSPALDHCQTTAVWPP